MKKMSTFSEVQEGPVNALALNRDNTQVAIGGRNVFKVYSIGEECFTEICNLRASKHLNLSFSCNDVAWSTTDDHYLATAATNGHVCVWNLMKTGKAMQEQDYQEHKRTVNKVNFHATEPFKLISGSQDGTMRYFDIRLRNAVSVFLSNTESVRDVQFNPHEPHSFAAVSENGSVQLWDTRKPDRCIQQFTAHSGPVFACDWHPEVKWLATASRDKTIKVWDLTHKPALEYTIHTIASIGHVKWRPQRKYHIASCSIVVDCSINIWDIRRPYIPFAAFNDHKDIASGVAWRGDPHTFLSTSRDCTLFQHAFKDAIRPASKANPQGISLNKGGDVIYAHRTPINTNGGPRNFLRKPSITSEHFHLASSNMYQFHKVLKREQDSFYFLASNYMLSGRSFQEICDHNAAIAKQYGKNNVSILWLVIKTMYGEEYNQYPYISNINREDGVIVSNIEVDNEEKPKEGEPPVPQCSAGDEETENEDVVDHASPFPNPLATYSNFKSRFPKGDFSFGDSDLDFELDALSLTNYKGVVHTNNIIQQPQDFTLPNEAFNIRHEILDRSPPLEQYANHNSPDLNEEQLPLVVEEQNPGFITVAKIAEKEVWNSTDIVVDALKYHADMGDVQTACTVLTVLGHHKRFLEPLEVHVQEHWMLGYLELLGRYKLWDVATEIIKLSWIPSINQMNQNSTRYNTNCSECNKPLLRAGWICDRCHSSEYALCSVCHNVVKGLYVWCQGCSHGGHLAHMREWYSQNRMCPTGCGHHCEFH